MAPEWQNRSGDGELPSRFAGLRRPDDGKSATWLTRGAAGVSQRTVSDCGDDGGRATPETHEALEGSAGCEAGGRAPSARRALLAACAAFIAVVALGLPGSGCLNPRPEELPSADSTQPNSPDPALSPIRETCDDNPLLAGCDLPDQDINADPVSDDGATSPGETPSNLGGESAPEPAAPGDEAPSGGDGAGGDAGADNPADAGAP